MELTRRLQAVKGVVIFVIIRLPLHLGGAGLGGCADLGGYLRSVEVFG